MSSLKEILDEAIINEGIAHSNFLSLRDQRIQAEKNLAAADEVLKVARIEVAGAYANYKNDILRRTYNNEVQI